MNTKILQKCLDALSQEPVSLDYIRGMLETLIEMDGSKQNPMVVASTPGTAVPLIQMTTVKDLIEKTDDEKEFERNMRGPVAPLS